MILETWICSLEALNNLATYMPEGSCAILIAVPVSFRSTSTSPAILLNWMRSACNRLSFMNKNSLVGLGYKINELLTGAVLFTTGFAFNDPARNPCETDAPACTSLPVMDSPTEILKATYELPQELNSFFSICCDRAVKTNKQ